MAENEQKGFTIIANEIIEMNIPPVEKTILIVLLRYNNSQIGYSFPSYTTLKEKCCISKNTLIKGINSLEKKNLIKKEVLKGKGNKYYIDLEYLKNITSSKIAPVQNLNHLDNYTSSKSEPHRFKNCTTLVQNLNPINTNINTTTKKSSNSKELEPTSNISKNKKSKNKTKKVFEPDSIEYKLSEKMYKNILEINPKAKEPNYQKWSKDFDLLIRVDKRSIKDIETLLDWIPTNNFWKNNILSPGALRGETRQGSNKFDTIYSQMLSDKNFKVEQNDLKEDIKPYSIEEMLKPI